MSERTIPVADEPVAGAMPQTDGQRWLVLNPTSGSADHTERVRTLGEERDYHIEETTGPGHAIDLAERAAEAGVNLLAVAGGDGTLHEVVGGLVRADALDRTTVAVVPTGTENIFAQNVGIETPEQAFDVVETGARRRVDLGVAGGEPFTMSCIAGLVANASVSTSDELKERFGSLAFLVNGLQEAASFDGLHIDLTATSNGEEVTWSGDALCALVGNSRRFVEEGGQANLEDGLLEVVVIERMPAGDIVAEAFAQRVFGRTGDNVFHTQASQLTISAFDDHDDPIDFSLDGEPRSHDDLTIHCRPRSLRVCVGPEYDVSPADDGD
ncbi:diacylglycerol/lipid kinase family protein [Halomarina oriensis]|uniref:YegS/Rv2252/BmrU family lipid kinase n=1 Tax=Halomarina oriensis TaxID=671145 RepID=A0A6B0GM97_9EURY|nr:YegS/Rv2252/BmrU family lipid kinase [Halomarina oriensis]MWG35854.1 YegS/Rv2252/BmrU family lipid kinase [Halomarina oriensis]